MYLHCLMLNAKWRAGFNLPLVALWHPRTCRARTAALLRIACLLLALSGSVNAARGGTRRLAAYALVMILSPVNRLMAAPVDLSPNLLQALPVSFLSGGWLFQI
jgi:hypothetical protein